MQFSPDLTNKKYIVVVPIDESPKNKLTELLIQEEVEPSPRTTPVKIFWGQGFGEGSLNSEY